MVCPKSGGNIGINNWSKKPNRDRYDIGMFYSISVPLFHPGSDDMLITSKWFVVYSF
jgi:hypothetical protein